MLNIDDRYLDILNANETFLCLQILRYMRPENMVSWPSITTLCEVCKWDERTVTKHLKTLCEKRVLQVEKSKGVANKYRFSGDGFGVYVPKNQDEPPTKNVGTKNVVPTQNVPTFFADNHPQKMGVEVINYEVINNTLSNSAQGPEKTETEKPAESQKTELEQVEEKILSWANSSAGAASILNRYQQAKKHFSQAEFESEVTGFCGWYLTRVDDQISQRFKRDPAGFFYASLHSWLNNPSKRKTQTQQPTQGNASRNSTIQNTDSCFNSQETLDRAKRVIARLQANGM